MKNNDLVWLEEALKMARKAEEIGEVPVGAVVVCNGEILSRAHNLRETKQSPTAHAEIIAIESAAEKLSGWRLSGCTLYVTLEPCPMCLAACQQARIDEVVFGALDPKGGALSLEYLLNEDDRMNHRFEVRLAEHAECGLILSQFFHRKRSGRE